MADEQQSISDDLIDELVTTAVGNIRPVRVYPEWQPIETAPKDGTRILVWGRSFGVGFPDFTRWITEWDGRQMWECERGEGITLPVAYWQPSPEPPR